jgi:hypothetical protein
MIDQNDFNHEVKERCTDQFVFKKLSEIDTLDEAGKAAAENAYRRGYFQGFCQAMMEMDNRIIGISDELRDFVCGPLYDWRFHKHNGKLEYPPEFHR